MVVVSGVEGSSLTIHFSSSLDIPQAASKVFGLNKNKVIHTPFTFTILVSEFASTIISSCQAFVGKTSTSVVETTIKVLVGNNSSQVISHVNTTENLY